MAKISEKIGVEVIKKSFFPATLFFLCVAAYVFYKIRIAPGIAPELYAGLKKYIGTVFIISACLILHKVTGAVMGWYKEKVASKTKTELDDKLIPLFARTAKVIIWVIAFLIILPLYGVNISALIATLGVSSLAIALAAQDTIANVIAGFLIMVDGPFKIGDRIKIPSGEIVQVLDIGVRRSKFRSEDNAIIIVPNVDLSKQRIINYTYGRNS